jgi:hypothetical protein
MSVSVGQMLKWLRRITTHNANIGVRRRQPKKHPTETTALIGGILSLYHKNGKK